MGRLDDVRRNAEAAKQASQRREASLAAWADLKKEFDSGTIQRLLDGVVRHPKIVRSGVPCVRNNETVNFGNGRIELSLSCLQPDWNGWDSWIHTAIRVTEHWRDRDGNLRDSRENLAYTADNPFVVVAVTVNPHMNSNSHATMFWRSPADDARIIETAVSLVDGDNPPTDDLGQRRPSESGTLPQIVLWIVAAFIVLGVLGAIGYSGR
jgi:hypothetical protein